MRSICDRSYIIDECGKVYLGIMAPRDPDGFIDAGLVQPHGRQNIAWRMTAGVAGRAVGESVVVFDGEKDAFCIDTMEADVDGGRKAVFRIAVQGILQTGDRFEKIFFDRAAAGQMLRRFLVAELCGERKAGDQRNGRCARSVCLKMFGFYGIFQREGRYFVASWGLLRWSARRADSYNRFHCNPRRRRGP